MKVKLGGGPKQWNLRMKMLSKIMRSKYTPHQGKQECERRKRKYEKALLAKGETL